MMKLYVFNPDQDLALARSDGRYDIGRAAERFSVDCAVLPLWYADAGAMVLAACDDAWLSSVVRSFPVLRRVKVCADADCATEVEPWGWNVHLRKALEVRGVRCLPDDERLQYVKRLSHRRMSAEALEFLRPLAGVPLPEKPCECFSEREVCDFLQTPFPLIFKAPWSGSGKGLFRLTEAVPQGFDGWVRNVIGAQRSVMAERFYDKVQDFAMEFRCTDEGVAFAGYSLFSTTVRGAYVQNELLSDEMIHSRLCEFVPADVLERVKNGLLRFFEKRYFPYYRGPLGVDMMVYAEDGALRLHPCVEINARMTMGMVARVFYDRFVVEGRKGEFKVDYFANAEDLQRYQARMSREHPLGIEDGRVSEGWMSLCPLTEGVHYCANICVKD